MQSHRIDALSLIAGLVFLAAGGAHMLGIDPTSLTVWRAWPLLLVLAGVVVLAGLARRPDDDD